MDFFHVLNRGVDKRSIVQDESDRLRFMQGLYLYNDQHLVNRNVRRMKLDAALIRERTPLVHIHAFCLMDNHYHLLLSPIDENLDNLAAFMRKLNMGYAKYFNEKYERIGALWQGKYKSIPVERDAHFMYLPYYIHLNPLDKKFPEWRDGAVTDISAALKYLSAYRWSSYLTYQNLPHYQSITHQATLKELLGGANEQTSVIRDIITDPRLAADSELLE